MKRILAGVALASAMALLATGPAHAEPKKPSAVALASVTKIIAVGPALAAPKNPVAAVQKQFVAGKGVTFVERVTYTMGANRNIAIRRNGTLQFSSTRAVASDVTGTFNVKRGDLEKLAEELGDDETAEDLTTALTMPERSITRGRWTYLTGSLWSTLLNNNRTWLRVPATVGQPAGVTGSYSQPLNILSEPAVLKTMLRGAKATRDGFTGRITLGQLRKVSPSFRATPVYNSAKSARLTISWKLSLDAKGLPARLVSVIPAGAYGPARADSTISVDTRFSGWGTPVSVVAPPELEVATNIEEAIKLPEAQTMTLNDIAH